MTKEEAKETVRRIFNFCEEIDNSLPDDEKTGYRMVHDVFTLLRYIDDVVEVVRCKDCKHSYIDIEGNRICNTDGYTGIIVKDNDFCSCGERKETDG